MGFRALALWACCFAGFGFAAQAATPTALAPSPQAKGPATNDFVKIVDGEFVAGCKSFYPAIWNQWEVIESSAGAPFLFGASLPPGTHGPQLVRSLLDQAPAAGLTVMRAWATTVDDNYALQPSPGVYNEAVFRGLDYTLDQASQRNIKVILALVDYYSSVVTYVKWTGDASLTLSSFYNNTQMIGWYQNWLQTITSRVNTINGRKYSEDPTIMAWDLINEPRCENCKPNQIAEWIGTMAKYLKTLDANHLVTTGEDGFYSTSTSRLDINPGFVQGSIDWATLEGQDFIADHSSPDIDFAVFHMWPDNWKAVNKSFVENWIDAHVDDATYVLKKPVLLEEFGKWANASEEERNNYFGYTFDEANLWISNNSALKGIGFWEWFDQGQVAPAAEGGGAGLYGITVRDPTWTMITKEMTALTADNGKAVAGCTPSPAPAPATKNCSSTEANNLPGTGYEGPQCTIDINECVRGTDNCAATATCINTPGSFKCDCWAGFSGNGKVCTATPQLGQLQDSYTTDGVQGPLMCDMAYPTVGPGVIYDPTGSTTKINESAGGQPGIGNPGPVATLLDCLIVCEMTPGCSVAVYSATTQQCLPKGCPNKYAVSCASVPPPNTPGGFGGPLWGPPAPPPAPGPACTLPASECPTLPAVYIPYQSKLRYDAECTQWAGNPGIMLAPSPSVGHLIATVPANIANNVSTASALGPGVELAPAPTASGFGTVLSAPTSAPVTGIPTMMMPSGAPSPAQHGTPSPAKHAMLPGKPGQPTAAVPSPGGTLVSSNLTGLTTSSIGGRRLLVSDGP